MNLLLVGIDGFDGNYSRAARADTLIAVGVNFSAKTAQMLSFPRDLWVRLPGVTQAPEARINTAYHYGELYDVPGGGPAELSAVMANTFGLRIDRFVIVSFPAFERGVDAIGGIDLDLAQPIHDANYPLRDGSGRTIAIDFPAGRIHMDGATALIYARIRHDSSDFQRMRRQQQVLFAIRDKLLSPETLPHLPALAQALYGAIHTNLTIEDVALLGCLGPQINQSAIQSWVIDGSMVEPTRLADGAQVLMPKMDALLPLLQTFNTGE
jgi:LCP family protein required for cell wall assembly